MAKCTQFEGKQGTIGDKPILRSYIGICHLFLQTQRQRHAQELNLRMGLLTLVLGLQEASPCKTTNFSFHLEKVVS